MVEKIGHIKNPLTVIAIFAGIAEISGTLVLPFLATENQSVYIWFLMFFPIFLVGLFFATLNFNPTALYSPSDYKDENNFVNSVRRATPEEVRIKLHREVQEVEAEIELEQDKDTSSVADTETETQDITQSRDDNTRHHIKHFVYDPALPHSVNHSRVVGELARSETLAIAYLSTALMVPFERNLTIAIPGKNGVTFDGFAIVDDTVHVAEVKLFPRSTIDVKRFYSSMVDASYLQQHLSSFQKQNFVYHAFIVAEASPAQISRRKAELKSFATSLGITVHIHIRTMAELVSEAT